MLLFDASLAMLNSSKIYRVALIVKRALHDQKFSERTLFKCQRVFAEISKKGAFLKIAISQNLQTVEEKFKRESFFVKF